MSIEDRTRLDYSTLVRPKCCHRNIFSYKYIIVKKGRKEDELI